MPDLRIKEVRLPELRLPEMSRDDITRAIGDATRDIDEALALVEARRHKVFKLKIGSHALAEDLAHVQAIRRGGGRDVVG